MKKVNAGDPGSKLDTGTETDTARGGPGGCESSERTAREAVNSKVHPDMTIGEILEVVPESARVLREYGMHCLGCPTAARETLREAAKSHELDLELLLGEIKGRESQK